MPDSSPFLKALKKEYKPLPSASIGQYTPSTPAPFSPQSAAASNPMLAPQFDTSYSPSSSGTSYEKKTPYDAGSAFNTGGSSFDSFGSAPTRRRYSNPISQTTYSEPLSFSDAGSSFQQPTTTTYQDPFQVFQSPFEFRSETSSPAVRPTEVTEITEAAPWRDTYTGAAAKVKSSTDSDTKAAPWRDTYTVDAAKTPTANRAETLEENVAAIESVAQVPMLGGFEVRGTGKERFDLGTPEVPETLFSKEYTDPGGNSAAIQAAQSRQAEAQAALQAAEAERQRINKATQERIDARNDVGTNLPDLIMSAAPYVKEGIGMAQSAGEGIAQFFTGKDVEIPNSVDLRMYDASVENDSAAERQRLSDQMIPAPAPVAPAPVAQDPTVNLPTETLTPDSSSLFDTQSTAGFDPKSLFDIGSTQGVTPQVAEKYQGEFADRELVGNLSGIIEKDGIEYGVVEGVPDENETIIKGGRGEFIEVSPERKAALERLGKLARTSEAVEERVKKNQSKWTQKQRDNFAETGNKNVSMSQKIAKDREFAANAPMREYNRFVEEQESKTRTTNRQLEKDKNKEIGDVLFDYPYSQRKAAERAIEEKYINIKRYNDQQNANAKREALSLANSGMQAARAAANLQAQQDSAAASLRQRQIEAQDLKDYRSRPAPPSTMREKLNVINSLPISQEEKNKRIYGLVGGEDYEYPGDEISNSAVTQQAKNIKEKLKEGEVAMMGPDNKPAAVPREEVEDAKLNGYVEL